MLLGAAADSFTSEQKTAALDFATTVLDSAVVCDVPVDETTGLPLDARFQLATATLAAQLLTAAPLVDAGATLTSETIGGYRYAVEGGQTTLSLLDVAHNDAIVALIGFCLPSSFTAFELDVSPDYVFSDFDVCCGGCSDCAYSAHGYGCCCSTPYRDTHYPYPAREVRAL
jgi:hypothetical protein